MIINIVILMYGMQTGVKVFEYGDSLILESKIDGYFDYNFTFTSDDGMNFAFGITDYSSN